MSNGLLYDIVHQVLARNEEFFNLRVNLKFYSF